MSIFQALQENQLKARVLTTHEGLADVSVSEIYVWSLLLPKVILSIENFGKRFQKFIFALL